MDICEKIDFVLRGGVWELLSEVLKKKDVSAIITELKEDDLVVINAVSVQPENLIFKGLGMELTAQFPTVPSFHKTYFDSFSVNMNYPLAAWKHVVRFCGAGWTICVFLREAPSKELLDDLRPFLDVISHWNSLRNAAKLDERLSSLSYMILATKNTLASVFEPMSIEYFASFIKDVLSESLFPKRVGIYLDDGKNIFLIKGLDFGNIVRDGVFKTKLLLPVPVVCNPDIFPTLGIDPELVKDFRVVILPIVSSPQAVMRIFCLMAWDEPCNKEMLNFMELLGNVSSKALEINELQRESKMQMKQLDSRSFTVAAFHNVLDKLVSYSDRLDLLSFIVGLFSESSNADRVKLVVYDSRERKYFLVGEAFGGIIAQCFDPLTDIEERIKSKETGELDKAGLAELGFTFDDLPQCIAYPFWVEGQLEGFVAMSDIKCDTEMPDYPVVFRTFSQTAGRELFYRFS